MAFATKYIFLPDAFLHWKNTLCFHSTNVFFFLTSEFFFLLYRSVFISETQPLENINNYQSNFNYTVYKRRKKKKKNVPATLVLLDRLLVRPWQKNKKQFFRRYILYIVIVSYCAAFNLIIVQNSMCYNSNMRSHSTFYGEFHITPRQSYL